MRTTSDPKETTVRVRMNEDMKNHLKRSSKRKGITISDYMRMLVRMDMANK